MMSNIFEQVFDEKLNSGGNVMKREINITEQDIRCCDGLDVCDDAVNATYELWFDVDK